jgi:hypothetical protein
VRFSRIKYKKTREQIIKYKMLKMTCLKIKIKMKFKMEKIKIKA